MSKQTLGIKWFEYNGFPVSEENPLPPSEDTKAWKDVKSSGFWFCLPEFIPENAEFLLKTWNSEPSEKPKYLLTKIMEPA